MIDEQVQPGLDRGDLAVLAIADAVTDAFAGSLVLFGAVADAVEVGFWLHPRFGGSGFATAAVELACQFVSRSGLAQVTARTAVDNTSSRHVLARAGFTLVGSAVDTAPSGHQLEVLLFSRAARPRAAEG